MYGQSNGKANPEMTGSMFFIKFDLLSNDHIITVFKMQGMYQALIGELVGLAVNQCNPFCPALIKTKLCQVGEQSFFPVIRMGHGISRLCCQYGFPVN